MTRKIKVKTKKEKKKITYNNVDEIQKDYSVLPKRKNRILCIVLKENHGTVWRWISKQKKVFRQDDNTYFILPKSIYLSNNKVLCCVFLEGVSLPLTHVNIDKEQRDVTYTNFDGKEITEKLTFIKGLKYDSAIIDMFLNRGLADEFTKTRIDLPNLIIIILLIVAIGLGIANIGVSLA